MGGGETECDVKRAVGRSGESNGRKMETIVIEQLK